MYCFFFTDAATTEIYTLSLHDALPISASARAGSACRARTSTRAAASPIAPRATARSMPVSRSSHEAQWERRSEEHTSELQSRFDLVCRLLLEKKKMEGRFKMVVVTIF